VEARVSKIFCSSSSSSASSQAESEAENPDDSGVKNGDRPDGLPTQTGHEPHRSRTQQEEPTLPASASRFDVSSGSGSESGSDSYSDGYSDSDSGAQAKPSRVRAKAKVKAEPDTVAGGKGKGRGRGRGQRPAAAKSGVKPQIPKAQSPASPKVKVEEEPRQSIVVPKTKHGPKGPSSEALPKGKTGHRPLGKAAAKAKHGPKVKVEHAEEDVQTLSVQESKEARRRLALQRLAAELEEDGIPQVTNVKKEAVQEERGLVERESDDEDEDEALADALFDGARGGSSSSGAHPMLRSSSTAGLEALGVRCVDADRVEESVVDRCDTAVELKHQQVLLDSLRREEVLWEQRINEQSGAKSTGAQDKQDERKRRLAECRDKIQRTEQLVNELLTRSKELNATDLSDLQAKPGGQISGASPPTSNLPPSGPNSILNNLASGGLSSAADLDSTTSNLNSQFPTGSSSSSSSYPTATATATATATDEPSMSQLTADTLHWEMLQGSSSSLGMVLDDSDEDDDDDSDVVEAQDLGEFGHTPAVSSTDRPPPPNSQASQSQAQTQSQSQGDAHPVLPVLSASNLARFTELSQTAVERRKEKLAKLLKGGAASRAPHISKKQLKADLRSELESKQKAEAELLKKVRKEESSAGKSSGSGAGGKYRINVNQLVPKNTGEDMLQWSKANPAEYKAMRTEGARVSGHKNLFDFKRMLKRKAPAPGTEESSILPTPPKARRDDDTSDKAYLRRQALWARTSTGKLPAARALSAKQPVGDDGQPLKEEKDAQSQTQGQTDTQTQQSAGSTAAAASLQALGQVKHEAGHAAADEHEDKKRIKLQEDVQVSDGLRSPRWLWEALYPYQHTCVKWLWDLHTNQMGGILADEMGLGKTVQIAAYLGSLHHSGVLQNMRIQNTSLGAASPAQPGGVLIVCPATLVTQWRNELHVWYPPLRVCVMHQVSERERRESMEVAVREQGVLITSYETMRTAHAELLKHTWVMVILDEGQKIRNPHANITIATKQFSTPHRILLSGSPIQNNLQELWSLFDFICPGRLGTLPVFLEEFAEPIEKGNLVGANETKVAAAYQCAMALRELTQPCILRRTKADCMDVLRLPHKQEQVLFCHLTPEQYQVYIEFLQTEQVRKAMTRTTDHRNNGAAFFSIGVLRKLCNHPDLLLRDADEKLRPKDMGNPERSGKMKVLAEIMKKWKAEGHRALIFVQTIQMLEIIQSWMQDCEYTFLRIDGKTPVKKRLKLIEEFNGDTSLFSMILTTRVGGVGLNIIGADRVLIFDPDWNPMTDVQARERTWRIGQKRDVTIYRLVLTGTVEEKIYQRQVYKHFLSQKILNDPRQRQFFKWNDMADLFALPPMPPNFSPEEMLALKKQFQTLFRKLKPEDFHGEEVETTDLMQSITALPTKKENKASKAASNEHSELLKTLYDSNGIKASFNHDKVEQPLLDRKIIQKGASLIASRAVAAVQKSARERASHHISEPTWTGQRGRAGGAPGLGKQEVVKYEGFKREHVKREIVNGCIVEHKVSASAGAPGAASSAGGRGLTTALKSSGVKPSHILDGLRQLAAIRASASARNVSQAQEASVRGVVQLRLDPKTGIKTEMPATPRTDSSAAPGMSEAELAQIEGDCVGLPIELHDSDRQIAEQILSTFLDPKLAGIEHSLTTGQVLDQLAPQIAQHHADLFKSLLKQLCVHSKPSRPGHPAIWTLKPEFCPK